MYKSVYTAMTLIGSRHQTLTILKTHYKLAKSARNYFFISKNAAVIHHANDISIITQSLMAAIPSAGISLVTN